MESSICSVAFKYTLFRYPSQRTIVSFLITNDLILKRSYRTIWKTHLKKSHSIFLSSICLTYRKHYSNMDFRPKMSTEVKFIAMINPQKTAIVKVFPTQKDAAEYCNFSTTGFTRAIKQGSISANHYWNYFDECDESLRTDFLAHNKLPDKHVFTKGTQIKQIDPRTGIVLKVHASKRDVVKQFQMSQTTLTKNIADGTIYNGYIWK